ncbi:MAG: MOSC domain-containing protein [Adlercreutzia equolifaciens]
MGVIKAVCTSDIKGIQKTEQAVIELRPNWGIEGDAHAAPWHRQVSLLPYEQIEAFKNRGAEVGHGAFGENIIVEGFDLKSLPIGTRFVCNDVVLELTQIGKQCHAHCAIYQPDGRLHHAPGGCLLQGARRRHHRPRRPYRDRIAGREEADSGDAQNLTSP